MLASLNWVGDLLGRRLDPAATAEQLTMLGAAVDAVEPIHQDLGDVVVALVEETQPHPNADRLTLCVVNAGGTPVEVVCGAPNVRAGRKYRFAPVGVTLPGFGLPLTSGFMVSSASPSARRYATPATAQGLFRRVDCS